MPTILRLCLILLGLQLTATAAELSPLHEAPRLAEVLRIERIDGSTVHRLGRAIDAAAERDAAVLTILSDATGDPILASALIDRALGAEVPLVVVVDGTLSGAATALALAHAHRVLTPDALLGAIGSPADDAGARSVLLAKCRQLSLRRNLPKAQLEALIQGEDLASYTAEEALEAGLIHAVAPDVASAAEQLGILLDEVELDIGATDEAVEVPVVERKVENVAYIHVEGVIDEIQLGYYRRSLKRAEEAGVDLIVTHIDSPGGHLFAAVEMLEESLRFTEPDQPRLIAFVDREAISAAAALAYSHEAIYVTAQAKIGDIGVIFQTSEGIEYAPEKIETFMRAQLRALADVRGWDRALLSKMTARNQILYEVHRLDGSTDYVIQDDLDRYLKVNPDVDRDSQVIALLGEDRLLTLTASEALEMGMATQMVASLEALYAQYGIAPETVMDFTPTTHERVAWSLAGWAPLLAALTVMFIMFELKTPGVGLWATLAAICGVAFFTCQYYLEMSSHLEVLLVVIGVALVAVELFTGIAGGALAVAGAAMMLVGLVLAFMPEGFQFDPSDDRWAAALGSAALNSLLATAVALVGVLLFIAALPHSPFIRRIAANDEITGTSASDFESGGAALVGRRVTVTATLHPGGYVELDGEERSARSATGQHLDIGTEVEVVSVQFGELVVRPAPAADRSDQGDAT